MLQNVFVEKLLATNSGMRWKRLSGRILEPCYDLRLEKLMLPSGTSFRLALEMHQMGEPEKLSV